LLLGPVPLGVTYALMWATPPFDSQAGIRVLRDRMLPHALAMTVVSVPHLALRPEMALIDERPS
jgi:Na+/melibiose symporter-like transporter